MYNSSSLIPNSFPTHLLAYIDSLDWLEKAINHMKILIMSSKILS
ncbi:23294_t:CDS:1, partial [Dentiscutata erythropus]